MIGPRFATITEGAFMRLKAAEQQKLYREAEDYFSGRLTNNMNAANRWKAVSEAKALYWEPANRERRWRNESGNAAPEPVKPPKVEGITAQEVNAFFATFPPLKLYGE